LDNEKQSPKSQKIGCYIHTHTHTDMDVECNRTFYTYSTTWTFTLDTQVTQRTMAHL